MSSIRLRRRVLGKEASVNYFFVGGAYGDEILAEVARFSPTSERFVRVGEEKPRARTLKEIRAEVEAEYHGRMRNAGRHSPRLQIPMWKVRVFAPFMPQGRHSLNDRAWQELTVKAHTGFDAEAAALAIAGEGWEIAQGPNAVVRLTGYA